jgi:vanillate O-demethylase ferredoxin subunit
MTGAPGHFMVRLARSGRSIAVEPGDTILKALRRAGLGMPSGCTAGTCGVCEARVLSGVPLHRDQIVVRDAQDSAYRIMTCCSRSRSEELTLDL